MTSTAVHTWGEGERVVLVHGGVSAAEETWQAQQPLSATHLLVAPDRQGYEESTASMPEDPYVDAATVADLLADGAHLVGYSMGALVAMLAAARRPDAVRSLVLVEPPAFDLVRGRGDTEEFVAGYTAIRDDAADAEQFLRAFLVFFGNPEEEVAQIPSPLPPSLGWAAQAMFTGIAPWDVVTPLDALRDAAFPKVLVSGGHSELFDATCEAVRRGIGGTLAVVPGAGHAAQFTGEPFNALLLRTWQGTEKAPDRHR
jgi:pimeloyl-ACP methyl ester carboxylesterase